MLLFIDYLLIYLLNCNLPCPEGILRKVNCLPVVNISVSAPIPVIVLLTYLSNVPNATLYLPKLHLSYTRRYTYIIEYRHFHLDM